MEFIFTLRNSGLAKTRSTRPDQTRPSGAALYTTYEILNILYHTLNEIVSEKIFVLSG